MKFFKAISKSLAKSVEAFVPKGGFRELVLLGDAVEFPVHWVEKRPVRCSREGCSFCPDKKMGQGYAVPVAILAAGGFGSWALSGPPALFNSLANLDERNNLKDSLLRVSRDPNGEYAAALLRPLSDGELEEIDKLSIIDVAQMYGVATESAGGVFDEEGQK